MPPAPWIVGAGADGYCASVQKGDETNITTDAELTFALQRGLEIELCVRRGAEPFAGAVVDPLRLSGPGESDMLDMLKHYHDVATDTRGLARLVQVWPGRFRFTVKRESAPWSELGRLELQVDRDTRRVEIELAPATELRGRVTKGARPLVGASVRGVVEYVSKSGSGSSPVASAGYARTDIDGRFRMTDLAPGARELMIEHPRLALPARWKLELTSGTNEVEHRIGDAELRGRAIDPDGQPIGALVLALSVPSGKTGFLGNAPPIVLRATTSSDGSFAFEDLPQGVAMTLAPEGGAYLPFAEPIELATNEVREDWVLRLARAGSLHVVIDMLAGTANVTQLVAQRGSDRRAANLIKTNEHTLSGLPPGTWTVSLHPAMNFNNATLAGPVDVLIEAGGTRELMLRVP
jgi:hypothetical protein